MTKRDPYKGWLDARQRWRDLMDDSLQPPEEIAAELRLSVIKILRQVAKGSIDMPGDVASELADAIEVLDAELDKTFLLPSSLSFQKWISPSKHPFYNSLREDAAAYLQTVHKGLIEDKRPTHTVALNYGVTQRTVQKWRARFNIAEVNRPPKIVKTFMEKSGKEYRKHRSKPKSKR